MTQTKQELAVGYQGTEGAYSQLAAKHHFARAGAPLRCVGYHSFREMLEAVKAGEVDVAVLPIENSIAGSINDSYDLLADTGLSLVGEEFQPIAHCLIGAADVPVADIRRVYSHPVALAQCGEFLETLEDCHVEAFIDTAMAVERASIATASNSGVVSRMTFSIQSSLLLSALAAAKISWRNWVSRPKSFP